MQAKILVPLSGAGKPADHTARGNGKKNPEF
jgi:hypothetical protein